MRNQERSYIRFTVCQIQKIRIHERASERYKSRVKQNTVDENNVVVKS
jgi:hypothetical protein